MKQIMTNTQSKEKNKSKIRFVYYFLSVQSSDNGSISILQK